MEAPRGRRRRRASELSVRGPSSPYALAESLARWFEAEARPLPWRRPDVGAWAVLVSEVMLQQTPVARVVPTFESWLDRWPVPSALAAEPAAEAIRAWGRLGYPRRALRLHAAAQQIAERRGDRVPSELGDLLALPGVGEYTARAVACFAFGRREPIVDTNTRRVLARAVSGEASAGAPSARRDHAAMEALLPTDPGEARLVNAAAMELGAVICTARAPRCEGCPVAAFCRWHGAGHPPGSRPLRRAQPRFEGSTRQRRGLILGALRDADGPVSEARIAELICDEREREVALRSLVADGLVIEVARGLALPDRSGDLLPSAG